MIRTFVLFFGIALVLTGALSCVIRLTTDGWAALALLGLLLAILANRWDDPPALT